DIRHIPASRRYPQFGKINLERSLKEAGIEYVHLQELGGHRKAVKGSKNDAWKNESFRGYADYMETKEFEMAIGVLKKMASEKRTAYMCAEAVWWSCHRSLVSDYLKVRGWKVMHIMGIEKALEHPYTSPAKVSDGKLTYSKNPELF
ncbi:MAG TPA: DUF488 domain-containing protein, partial [Bacteroidia bacterium]